MRSQSAPSRNCAGSVAIALGLSLAVAPGRRPNILRRRKQACSAAYDQAQELRLAGKLSAAHEQALICVRDACAEFIRTDCAKWLGEIESSQPTVVFDVRDSAGQETSAVRVSLDGKPWLDKLDGSAKAIDPGEHTLHLEMDGAPAVDQTVQIREGQKNHELTATFSKTAPASVVSVAPTPSGCAGRADSAFGCCADCAGRAEHQARHGGSGRTIGRAVDCRRRGRRGLGVGWGSHRRAGQRKGHHRCAVWGSRLLHLDLARMQRTAVERSARSRQRGSSSARSASP